MIFNLHKYRTAKVSNYQNLLQRALDKFDEVVPIKLSDPLIFDIHPIDIEANCGTINVKIGNFYTGSLGLNRNNIKNPCGNFFINLPLSVGKYIDEDQIIKQIPLDRNTIRNAFKHEITHISQTISGFMNYEDQRMEKIRKEDVAKGIPWGNARQFYDSNHDKFQYEQEANLVFLCSKIQDDMDEAVNFMVFHNLKIAEGHGIYDEKSLAKFELGLGDIDFKKFVNKAHYLGLSKMQILEFRQKVAEKTFKQFDKMKKNIDNLSSIYWGSLKTLDFLNIDREPYTQFYRQQIIKRINRAKIALVDIEKKRNIEQIEEMNARIDDLEYLLSKLPINQ